MGVIINKPIVDVSLPDIFQQLKLEPKASVRQRQVGIFSGGPVHPELGMVLHIGRGEWESTLPVGEHFGLTTSLDIIEALANGEGPEHCMFILGYAGWSAGQLEHEIQQNSWLNTTATEEIIFSTPVAERWSEAANLLGVDLTLLSTNAGHA